jgi:hypothetical protein
VDQSTIVGLKMDQGKKEEQERTPLAQIVGLPDFEVSCFSRQVEFGNCGVSIVEGLGVGDEG